jgi:hypothetical protein
MSPTPLIELQRRLSLVGAIRAGGERPAGGKRPGAKLENWRITSPRQTLVEQAATLYGGEVSAWEGPNGREWQCYTTVDELPVLVMPSYSLRQTYELWEGVTKRKRLCDGVDEELSGGPCICNAEGDDKCDVYTRLVVALPELDTVLGWRLITKGVNAAHELPTMINLIQQASTQQFVPARLRLEQRRGVVDGQVARFVVPTIDLGIGYLALTASPAGNGSPALPGGEQRERLALTRQEPTVEQALSAVDAPRPVRASGRSAAAFGAAKTEEQRSARAVAGDEAHSPGADSSTGTAFPTERQIKALNALVGQLRAQGEVTTASLYDSIAKLRNTGGLDLAMIVDGYDAEHVLHWSPLRDALTRAEASKLYEWLSEKQRRVERARQAEQPDAGESQPATSTSADDDVVDAEAHEVDEHEQEEPSGDVQQHDVVQQLDDMPPAVVPYNQFPDGY